MSNSTTVITANAGDHYHIMVAKSYIRGSLTAEEILEELKASKYIVKLNGTDNVKLNAISILGLINGYRLALDDINRSLKSGTHKASKAKGIYKVTTKEQS